MSFFKKAKPYLKVLGLISVFAFLFINQFLGIASLGSGDLATLWYQSCILIGFIAIFYIIKIHKFYITDILFSLLFGVLISLNNNFNPLIAPITVLTFYSACCIFRKYNFMEKVFASDLKTAIKSIGFGLAVGIIPAMINVVEYYIKGGYTLPEFSFSNLIPGAIGALQPGIYEEILFRFFLYAFVVNAFKGEIPKNKFATIMTWFLMICPHCIMHGEFSVERFISEPFFAIANLVYMCVVFGVPTVWLMKKKNIQSSMAAHWLFDFLRFWIAQR